MRGLKGSFVTKRCARFHYGTNCHNKFIVGRHPLSSKFWSFCHRKFKARNTKKSYVPKNDPVCGSRHIAIGFKSEFYPRHSLIESSAIWSSSSDKASLMYSILLKKVCTLEVDFSKILRRAFPLRRDRVGDNYRKLAYDLVMKIDSGTMDFELNVNDVEYGSVSASFDEN